jgi:hypothetical protein
LCQYRPGTQHAKRSQGARDGSEFLIGHVIFLCFGLLS